MTGDQCLEHPWLKQYPKKAEIIETQPECITNGDIKSPVIEVEVRKLCTKLIEIVLLKVI